MTSSLPRALRASFIAATFSVALTASALAGQTQEPGYVDFGPMKPAAKGEFVEVNIPTGLLRFASRLAKSQDPAAAELIANLRRVRVNVVTLDDENRAETVARMETVRRKLESEGWMQVVSVREKDGGDNVNIHVKQQSDDSIDGLVVTVLQGKGEAVFVNIVGNINADRIGELAQRFDIEPLRKLKLPPAKS
ncbi:MAG: DUF4252 domain-containing protein [Opitutaceae bacterium]|nr:DUF4252 domain-containing protein [Opitutaceae bacterium]